MRACAQLAALYDEWRRLTHEEGVAIDQTAWNRVHECQESKHLLQTRIVEVSQGLETEWAAAPDRRLEEEPRFRQTVEELIRLENENSERLAARRREAEAQQKALNKTSRSLRDIQRRYGGSRDHSWNSYS